MLGPNSYVSLNSIVFYAIVISVALQLVTYISFGCLADHGSYRKKLMYAFSYATAISGMCLLLVLNNSLWWISYILFILSGVTFGSSYVYYYAHVPLLTRSSEDVIKARRTG
jgi:UMF1 family MFS transporter